MTHLLEWPKRVASSGEWDRVVAVIRAIVARGEHRWSARHLKAGHGTGAELE